MHRRRFHPVDVLADLIKLDKHDFFFVVEYGKELLVLCGNDHVQLANRLELFDVGRDVDADSSAFDLEVNRRNRLRCTLLGSRFDDQPDFPFKSVE